jgi:hypothetical protein
MVNRKIVIRLLVALALAVPAGLSAAEAGGEWSAEKPWWVYTVTNVAQKYSSPSQYTGESKHYCSNGTGWWSLGDLNCAD